MRFPLKERVQKILDNIEWQFFEAHNTYTDEQIKHLQAFLDSDSHGLPSNLIRYYKRELQIDFIFNTIILGAFSSTVRPHFRECWTCNPVMLIWLLGIVILTLLLILPKILYLNKLSRIERAKERTMRSFVLWGFHRARLYKINMGLSKCIFLANLIGAVLFFATLWLWNDKAVCEGFSETIKWTLGLFVIRAVLSYLRHLYNFSSKDAKKLVILFEDIEMDDLPKFLDSKVKQD